MTWLKSDSGHKTPSDPLSRRGRAPAQEREAMPVPQELLDEHGEPTMSVFGAMGVGENGQGIWGEESREYPMEMQRELLREHNWPTERQWALTRRMMARDVEAV